MTTKSQPVAAKKGPMFQLQTQATKGRPVIDKRKSNMAQLENAIMQRFKDINHRDGCSSDENNESSDSNGSDS